MTGILDDFLSDHLPIFAIRKKDRERVTRTWKTIRLYRLYNEEMFKNLLGAYDWGDFYDKTDPDELWAIISMRIQEILSVMCPYKRILLRDRKTPWITPEIINCIQERSKFMKIFRRSGNEGIFEIVKYLRNKINSLVRKAKSEYIKANLRNNRTNPKKFWRTLNNVLKGETSRQQTTNFVDPISNKEVPTKDACDFLNNFFVNIGSTSDNVNIPDVDIQLRNDYVFEIPDVGEIRKLVKKIDISKDSCLEGVKTEILKTGFLEVINQLTHLFTKSLNSGIFPRKWAVGFVNILPKGGDLRYPTNWRPITQTCIPSKLMEKIIHKRLLDYLLQHNLLDQNQYGFLHGKSTQKAVFDLIKDIYNNINNEKDTGLLFLDVRKAFDSLNHKILLRKLCNIGLPGNILRWFENYLDREQYVRYNGNISKGLKTISGIPQGSILGPTLFIFYINGVFDMIDNVEVKMFADDCVLYKSGDSWNDIHANLQAGLDNYITWSDRHCLLLNSEKTKAMVIPSKRNQVRNGYAHFNAGNRQIKFVKQFSYLGVLLDNEMSLSPFYKSVKKQVEHKLFSLRKIRFFIDQFAAVSI